MAATVIPFRRKSDNATDPERLRIEKAFEILYLAKKASTVQADKYAIKPWFTFHGYIIPKEEDVLRYIDHAREKLNHTNRTIKTALIRLRKGFETFDVADHFTKGLTLVKTSHFPEKRNITAIPFDKVMRLVECPGKSAQGLRDAAHIALMLGGGLRITEALTLTVARIRTTEKGALYVRLDRTKKGTPAEQAIAPSFAQYVYKYLERRLKEGAKPDDVFLTSYNDKGKPTNTQRNRRNATRSFQAYAKKCGIDKISPHSCRATAITKLLHDNKTYREVQEFSRHSSVQMVERYDKRYFGVDDSPAQDLSFEKKKDSI